MTKKKKLLILNTDSMDCSYGGVCPFMRHMHIWLDDAFDLSYIYLPNKWKTGGFVRIKYLLYLWINRYKFKKFDFILSHSPEGSYMASYAGVPYAHIYHGNSNPMAVSRYKVGKYFGKLWDKMFERIESTAELLYSVGPVRNQKHKKMFNPLCQNVLPQPTDKRHGFIFAGRLESVKNIDRLIEIYSQLPKEIRQKHHFYIAGNGTLYNQLRALAHQKCLDDEVIFLGEIENSQMMHNDADKKILLMASTTEGFPTAIAEAFSVGVPVISTNVGDIAYIVKSGKNGILLPVNFRNEDYIDAIYTILSDYDRFSSEALAVSKVFDAKTVSLSIISDINNALKRD